LLLEQGNRITDFFSLVGLKSISTYQKGRVKNQ
jgi:hypothetical protein